MARKRKLRWLLGVIGGLLFVVLALVLWTAKEIKDFGSFDSGEKADAAIVLGAAAWNGKPSPVLQERINHALLLYRQKRVQKIILTGGVASGDTVSEARAGKQFALAHGVRESDLLVEEKSKTTYENLVYARDVASQNGIKTFLVVSDPLHMRRSMDMAGDLRMSAKSSPTRTSRFVSRNKKLDLLWREARHLLQYRLLDRHVLKRI